MRCRQQSRRRHRTNRPQAFDETVETVKELRDKIANFDDFFRPLRNYFYWEPHCFDIPICSAVRSVFDALDGVDALTDQFGQVTASLDKLDALQPQLLELIPQQIASPGAQQGTADVQLRHPDRAATTRRRRR